MSSYYRYPWFNRCRWQLITVAGLKLWVSCLLIIGVAHCSSYSLPSRDLSVTLRSWNVMIRLMFATHFPMSFRSISLMATLYVAGLPSSFGISRLWHMTIWLLKLITVNVGGYWSSLKVRVVVSYFCRAFSDYVIRWPFTVQFLGFLGLYVFCFSVSFAGTAERRTDAETNGTNA